MPRAQEARWRAAANAEPYKSPPRRRSRTTCTVAVDRGRDVRVAVGPLFDVLPTVKSPDG